MDVIETDIRPNENGAFRTGSEERSTSSTNGKRALNDIQQSDSTLLGSRLDKIVAEKSLEDADEAMQITREHGNDGPIILNEADTRQLLRKIDRNILPVMCLVYGLNFLDKTTLSYASIMGLEEDLHLTKNNYQWLGSIFYFGYLGFEYPTSRLLQRLPLAKYSGANVILWGTVLACTAACTNFGSIAAVRFTLGMLEASVTPGFVLFTSQWYTKKEQGTRTGIWFSFNGFSTVLGGLVAYGIAKGSLGRHETIASWKILFLVWGLVTFVAGVCFVLVMPDNPLKARFLSPQERRLAVERTRTNQQGIGNKRFKRYQFKEAMTDPQTWAFVLFALFWDIPNGGIGNFFSQLVVSFGFTPTESLLYGCPNGAIGAIALLMSGYLGDRFNQRLLVSSIGLWIAMIGMVLIVALPLSNKGGRLAGYYMISMTTVAFASILSLISSNVAGHTKKTTVAALFLIAYCAGNIIGPQTFVAREAPRYRGAEITILGTCKLLSTPVADLGKPPLSVA
ncbi:MAG: hypothetical protein Q9191_003397 [Dirinaria sp. TL-2023a]